MPRLRPCAVGISVQTKSTVSVSSAMSMAGAVSAAGWMSAPAICGRHWSYQMVAICAVQLPEARSAMLVAFAKALSAFVRQTMVA